MNATGRDIDQLIADVQQQVHAFVATVPRGIKVPDDPFDMSAWHPEELRHAAEQGFFSDYEVREAMAYKTLRDHAANYGDWKTAVVVLEKDLEDFAANQKIGLAYAKERGVLAQCGEEWVWVLFLGG